MNSEQHTKVMPNRQIKDNHDIQILLQWSELRNLFHPGNPALHSLSSGLTASN